MRAAARALLCALCARAAAPPRATGTRTPTATVRLEPRESTPTATRSPTLGGPWRCEREGEVVTINQAFIAMGSAQARTATPAEPRIVMVEEDGLAAGGWALVFLGMLGVGLLVFILASLTDTLLEAEPRLPVLKGAPEDTGTWQPERAAAGQVVGEEALRRVLRRHAAEVAARARAAPGGGAVGDDDTVVAAAARCADAPCRVVDEAGGWVCALFHPGGPPPPSNPLWLPADAVRRPGAGRAGSPRRRRGSGAARDDDDDLVDDGGAWDDGAGYGDEAFDVDAQWQYRGGAAAAGRRRATPASYPAESSDDGAGHHAPSGAVPRSGGTPLRPKAAASYFADDAEPSSGFAATLPAQARGASRTAGYF